MKLTHRVLLSILCFCAIALLCHPVCAALVTQPEGLAPGTHYRLVFVTAGTHDAMLTDIAEYNNFVTLQANSSLDLAALSTNWTVLGSTASVDAMANTNTNPTSTGVSIYNLNGQLVADGNADLWDGGLANAINITQNGTVSNGVVFTGTGADGLGIPGRQLGADGFRVQYGYSNAISSGWTNANDWSGSLNGLYFYGISDVLVAVPEPATLVLLGVGVLAVRKFGRKVHLK